MGAIISRRDPKRFEELLALAEDIVDDLGDEAPHESDVRVRVFCSVADTADAC